MDQNIAQENLWMQTNKSSVLLFPLFILVKNHKQIDYIELFIEQKNNK